MPHEIGEMSSPSVVFNRGLRYTKVKRVSIPVSAPTAFPGPLSPVASTLFSLFATPSPQSSLALSGAYSTPSTFSIRPSTLLDPPEKIHPTISLTPEVQVTSPPNVGVFPPTPVASETPYTGKTKADTSTPTVDSRIFGASHNASSSIGTTSSATTTAGTGSAGYGSTQNTDGLNKDNLPGVIVGSILGVLGFIAFVALICFFLLRRRRRVYGDTKSLSSNGKLSRIDRNSVPTLTSWAPRHHSAFSFHASPASGQSPPNRIQFTHTPELTPPKPILFHNPFSKSTEACIEAQLDNRSPGTIPLNPFADPTSPNNNTTTVNTSPTWKQIRPSKPNIIEWQPQGHNSLVIPRSLYGSDHSLGSTIILPGRNSSVGSLQVISYRLSSPSATSPRVIDLSAKRISARSARSDPFDLEVPVDAVHSRA